MNTTTTPLLTPAEAARLLCINQRTLANWRANQRYELPYVKTCGRIRYRREDIAAFIEAGTVRPGESDASI